VAEWPCCHDPLRFSLGSLICRLCARQPQRMSLLSRFVQSTAYAACARPTSISLGMCLSSRPQHTALSMCYIFCRLVFASDTSRTCDVPRSSCRLPADSTLILPSLCSYRDFISLFSLPMFLPLCSLPMFLRVHFLARSFLGAVHFLSSLLFISSRCTRLYISPLLCCSFLG